MFKMKKNEQNENILYLSGILNYHIMFTIFKFPGKCRNVGTGKFFVQKSKKFEHYKGRNRKIQKIKKFKK